LRWVGDIAGGLSVPAIVDYLELWDTLENVQLLENQPDQHLWTPESSGTYSARSAYARFFVGSSGFEPYKRLWKSWAPLRCKIFSGWPCSIGAGQRIGWPVGVSNTQTSASFAIKRRQSNTFSHLAFSQDRFGRPSLGG